MQRENWNQIEQRQWVDIFHTGIFSVFEFVDSAGIFSTRHSSISATATVKNISSVVPPPESCSQPLKLNAANKTLKKGKYIITIAT